MNILVIDDDRALCRSLEIHLERTGHRVSAAASVREGIAALKANDWDLALVDLKLPDGSGMDILTEFAGEGSPLFAVITGAQDTRATIEAVRRGAFDYIRKPLDLDALALTLEKAGRELSRAPDKTSVPLGDAPDSREEIVGADPKIIEVIKQIGLLSQNDVPVLIEGESGVGKELVARALHDARSPGRPFVAVNCSAVVGTLLESELFGHEKGAFTGADAAKPGKLEIAGEGTVLFDEIGDMSMNLQAKLLRVVQEREFERVGGVETIPLKARIVAATNRDLADLAKEGEFRQDLMFRMEVARIRVPPLRERRADIPRLARSLLRHIAAELHKDLESIEEDALDLLARCDWPGNVRELRNALTRAALYARGGAITKELVEASLGPSRPSPHPGEVKTLREAEREHVLRALRHFDWNITRTASALDISPTTLRKKIADYGLSKP